MPSHELLEWFGVRWVDDHERKIRDLFVDFAPEDGALGRALREGGWTEDQQIRAETFNEIARLRASFHASKGREYAYEPFAFEDPRVQEQRARQAVEAQQLQMEVEADLFGWD